MGEPQLKYIEIVFDKQMPQNIGVEINILSKIDSRVGDLEYKFIVGKGGIWNTIQEFSDRNECIWKPKREGEYMVMVQAREKDGKKPLDYLAREDYAIVNGELESIVENGVANEKVVNGEKMKIDFKNIIDNDKENLLMIKNEDFVDNNTEFKDIINDKADNTDKVVFLEAKELSTEEKSILVEENNINNQVILNDNDIVSEKLEDNIESESSVIKEIIIDKEEVVIGEKCTIEVKTIYENMYLYRFYIKKYNDWDIVRDYDTNSILKYTATEAGEKEFLIQCKKIESTDNFEDYRVIKINVKDVSKIEITNFKCLSKSLIIGEKLEFRVETNINSKKKCK